MNLKNFIICGLVAGVADFLLGWLTYGFLFKDFFENSGEEDMRYIVLGCFAFGFLFSLFFTKAGIRTVAAGVTSGALFAFLYAVTSDSFMRAAMPLDKMMLITDVLIMTVTGAIIGPIVATVLAKLSPPTT
ncbi:MULTISPECIES: hypothetical protein [unclassified Flavobacterium]|uniref:hypothetical protein n=1 Tax=unclassified Flavobacterium TaxID=196869 RepID=UPI001F12AD1B|nr:MULTISPECIES: hypothetical protein [unclassified Flavobacterium]UMY64622.1 hypothetical protein MKO97_08865 [Flavobacterium sp. HJ-32-4]